MADQEIRRVAFETARLQLARVRGSTGKVRDTAFRLVTQVVADALKSERVGIWMFEAAGRRLVCEVQFVRSGRSYEAGQVLLVEQYPRYFAALEQRRALPADDARTHPITSELAESYLVPNRIVSMLDAPIIRDGRVVGVICQETVGEARVWTQAEVDFAGSVADIVALLLEQGERVELEAALGLQAQQRLEASKLEAVGRMARTVAHDLNNLMAVVIGVADEASHGSCPSCQRHAQSLTGAAEVGTRLVRRLFDVGGRDLADATSVDVAKVLHDMTPALRTLVGRAIALDVVADARRPEVQVPRAELEQVILNLVVNARDAVKPDGRIEVRLREPVKDDDLPADRLVLEVSDDGAGMDEHTRSHLFEPYFTTKPQGTGLGLAIVSGVARRAGGCVQVASQPGQGSIIQVVLPRHLGGRPPPADHRA
jgi:signal transduction histidine kinase